MSDALTPHTFFATLKEACDAAQHGATNNTMGNSRWVMLSSVGSYHVITGRNVVERYKESGYVEVCRYYKKTWGIDVPVIFEWLL